MAQISGPLDPAKSDGWAVGGRVSDVGGPAQTLELAAETLAGPAFATRGPDVWAGVSHDRRAVVDVTGGGDEGSDPRLDRPHDLDDTVAIRDASIDAIAGANLR